MSNVISDNKLVGKNQVEDILNKLGNIGDNGVRLEVKDVVYYQTAFVQKSYMHEVDKKLFIPPESNERLEFLGDSFIGAIVANYLVRRFHSQQEGFLTKLRTRIVRSSMLYNFARYLKLGGYILVSVHIQRLTELGSNKGRNNPRLYEDCFESFVGAIIQDFGDEDGYRYAKRFLVNIIEHLIDFAELITCNENFKDILQRYFQSLKWSNPVYIDLYESGPSHMKNFIKGIFIEANYFGTLSFDVQQNIKNYQTQTILQQGFSVRNVINDIIKDNSCYLIGLGSGNKKSVAEQTTSQIALSVLEINTDF